MATTSATKEQTQVTTETATSSGDKTVPPKSAEPSSRVRRNERIKAKETTCRAATSATTIPATTDRTSATTAQSSPVRSTMTWQPLSACRSAPSRLRESRDLEIVDDDEAEEAQTKAVPVTDGRLTSPATARSGSLSAPIDCEKYEPPTHASTSDVIIMIEPLDTESRPESDTSPASPTGVNPSHIVAPSAGEKKLLSLTPSDRRGALPTVEPSGGRKTQQNVAPSFDRKTLPSLKLDAEKYRLLRALILQAVKVCISQGQEFGPIGQELEPSPGKTTTIAERNNSVCSGEECTKGSSREQAETLSENPNVEHGHPTVPRSVGVDDNKGTRRRREDHVEPTPTTAQSASLIQRRHPTLRELISGTVPPKHRSVRPFGWRCRSKLDASSDTDDGDGDESRINVDDTDTDADD